MRRAEDESGTLTWKAMPDLSNLIGWKEASQAYKQREHWAQNLQAQIQPVKSCKAQLSQFSHLQKKHLFHWPYQPLQR